MKGTNLLVIGLLLGYNFFNDPFLSTSRIPPPPAYNPQWSVYCIQVVSVTREDQEMIVINPQWLCQDIIGKLLAHDSFNNRPDDGRFLLQAHIPV